MVALATAFVRLRPQPDRAEFRKAGEEMGSEAGKGAGDKFGGEFTRGSDGKLRESRGKFVGDSEKAGTEAGGKTGKSFGKSFDKATKGDGKTSVFSKVLQTTAARYTLLGGAAASALPSVIRLTAAIAPAAGALVVLPAVLSAGAIAAGTFKVAVSGVGDAIKAGMTGTAKQAQKALDALPPSARKFASAIVDLKPKVDKLRASVSQRFFKPFADDIKPLVNQYFPLIRRQMSGLAEPLGRLAEQFIQTARSSAVMKSVSGIFSATRKSVTELRGAVDPLVKAFAALIRSTAHDLPGLATDLVRAARAVSSFVTDAAKSGRINAVFAEAKRTIRDLFGVIVNVGSILGSVFKAASAGSAGLLGNLKSLTGQAAAFLKSGQGIAGLTAVFSTLSAIGAGLHASLGAVLPALAQSLAILGPAIAGLAGPASQLITALAPLLPIFAGTAATLITRLTPAIAALAGYLAQHAQLVKAAAVALGAFLTIQRLSAIATDIQKLGLLGYIKQIKVVAAATKVWAGIQTAFNLIMDANPIALVVIAIAALVAGIIIAYKHSQTFRDIVQGAFNGIKTAAQAVASFFTGTVWPALVGTFNAVKGAALYLWHNVFEPVWHGIQAVVSTAVAVVRGVISGFVGAYRGLQAAALYLWHNVFEPVWHGIQAVVSVVVGVVRGYLNVLVGAFNVVKAVVTFLYTNIFAPIFGAIRKVVEIWWLATEIIFKAFYLIVRASVIATLTALQTAWNFVFGLLRSAVALWWRDVKIVFGLFRTYVFGPVVAALTALKNFFTSVFSAIVRTVTDWYRAHIVPIFNAVRTAWDALAAGFLYVYNNKIKPAFTAFINFFKVTIVGEFRAAVAIVRGIWDAVSGAFSAVFNGKIKPVFNAFVGFIKNTVVGGFQAGVNAIKAAWDKVQEYARKPVAFVVNHVINPFINGLNNAASIVGVKDRVAPISGFREGGELVRRAAGGKIEGAGGISDNRQAMIPGVGAVQLQGGEFVIRREMTAKALPLIRWVNDGMKGGAQKIAQYLGRPLADMPGDGSEGWAFRDGGLVGWVKDVWGAISHPLDTIKKPFESALSQIPGVGLIKDFLVGAANKVVGGAISWITKLAGGSGKVGDAVKFLHAQDGKPYVWASAGPGGYDCSGIVSAVYNLLHGHSPYSHTFSTESASSFFPKPGQNGQMAAAWSHPGQAPAGPGTGHMMGRVGNLNFESTGSRGVHLGNTTRQLSDFANVGHYRDGGLLEEKIRLFDSGGLWPSGTLGANLSGRTEYVSPDGAGRGGDTFIFGEGAFSGAIMANSKQAEDLVVGAIKSAKRNRRLT